MRSRLRRFAAGFAQGVKGVAGGLYRDDCVGLASQMAYSALFSLFPFLLFLRAVTAYIPAADQLGDWLLRGLRDLVTEDSELYEIVRDNVFDEISTTSVTLLSIGIVLTLWSASSAVMVAIKAINRAYGLEETRSWHRRRLMAAALSVAGVVLLPVGILLLTLGSWIGDRIGGQVGYGTFLHDLWVGLRWPVAFLLLVAVVGAFYFLAPSRRQRWYSVLPGALFTVASVIGTSVGLSWFLSQNLFQVRWLTYGVLGAAIVLLFWAFLIGLMVLVGGEINAAVRRSVEGRQDAAGADPAAGEPLLESEHHE